MPISLRQRSHRLIACCLLAASGNAPAAVYPLPAPGDDQIGRLTAAPVRPRDTLAVMAYRYGVGFRPLIHANPQTNPWAPQPRQKILLPTVMLLPPGSRAGIVVNVPEMRLYYYPPGEASVHVYPVAVGRVDWKTPLGETTVTHKIRNPVWYPTASIRAEHAALNDPLPVAVAAGPDNPLGNYALRLGFAQVLIHGTNKALGGIGMPVTHGCIRLYPNDIQTLFEKVPAGTPVRFINEPYKLGRHQGQWYLEAHTALSENPQAATTLAEVMPGLAQVKTSAGSDGAAQLNWYRVAKTLKQSTGLPTPVGTQRATPGSSASRPPNASAAASDSALPQRLTSVTLSRTRCSDRC